MSEDEGEDRRRRLTQEMRERTGIDERMIAARNSRAAELDRQQAR